MLLFVLSLFAFPKATMLKFLGLTQNNNLDVITMTYVVACHVTDLL